MRLSFSVFCYGAGFSYGIGLRLEPNLDNFGALFDFARLISNDFSPVSELGVGISSCTILEYAFPFWVFCDEPDSSTGILAIGA